MKKKILLIDSFGIIFKSYYALIKHPMHNSRGENSGAIFGFFKNVLSAVQKIKPDYIVLALEGEGKCFRKELYPEYKANRQEPPVDLKDQIPIIIDLIKELKLPFITVNDCEADDVIGTIATKISKEHSNELDVLIYSSDKDLMQLVNDSVFIVKQSKLSSDFVTINSNGVYETMGVTPEQIVDYLALTGDSSDNIPGVRGIGPKGASALLEEYKDLASIYDSIDSIKSKNSAKKLEESKGEAFLSQELATIKRDLNIKINLDSWKAGPIDISHAKEKLDYYELKTVIETINSYNLKLFGKDNTDSVSDESPLKTIADINKKISLITEESELQTKIDQIKQCGIFSFDLETTNFDCFQGDIICVSIGFNDEAFVIPVNLGLNQLGEMPRGFKNSDTLLNQLADIFNDEKLLKIGQNLKFDIKFLKANNIEIKGPYFDTMLAEYSLDSYNNRLNLDTLAEKYLNYKTVKYEELINKKNETLQDAQINSLVEYSGQDSYIALKLYEILTKKLEENTEKHSLFYSIEMPLMPILVEAEFYGVNIDRSKLNTLSSYFEEVLININDNLMELAEEEFNPNSPKQIAAILFDKMKLPVIKKNKTGPSTDESVLEKLAVISPIADYILKYRSMSKLKSTYSDALPALINPATNKVHTTFMQAGTQTGRLSSKDPNLQNIPIRSDEGRKIRSAFCPSEGCTLVSADYSQIELFLLAEFSRDKHLYNSFKTGEDIHKKTASLLLSKSEDDIIKEERDLGKKINFSVLYGQSAFSLADNLKISRKEAQFFIDKYFEEYSGVKNYIEELKDECRKTGYSRTYYGRIRTIPEIHEKNKIRLAYGERMAVNSVIQGTAADLIKIAMVRITKSFTENSIKSRLIIQVHDELIFDVPDEELDETTKLIRYNMEENFEFSIKPKTSIECGSNWGELH